MPSKEEVKRICFAIGACCIRALTSFFNIFPLQKKRIMFYSFNGKYFNDNPRELYAALAEHSEDGYEFVWSFRNPEEHRRQFPDSTKLVKFRSLKHYYYMKTSKIVVYNVHEEGEVARRKRQFYIQTWHASNGYKNLKTSNKKIDRMIDHLHHKNYSYVCSGCKSMEDRRVRESMQFKGEVIRGTPRMDQIINCSQSSTREELCRELQIPDYVKLLIFAPTWKENRSDINYGLDYEVLRQCLTNKFGGEWYILVRFHPNVKAQREWDYGKYVINVTNYPEMQKLLCASDVMISDYSSCVWDFSFTYRPCFLFLPNFEEIGGNDILEIPIEKWGFPYCYSMEELKTRISEFDYEVYSTNISNHHKIMGSYEDGNATNRAVALIESILKND